MPGSASAIQTREFALYSLDGPCPAATGNRLPPFSPARYSRYKYGSVAAADSFTRAPGAAFCERHPELALAARTFLYIAAFPGPADGCFDPTQEDGSTTPP